MSAEYMYVEVRTDACLWRQTALLTNPMSQVERAVGLRLLV